MKFCVECGSRIKLETAKFCPKCGKGLLMNLSDQSPQSHKDTQQNSNEALDSQEKNENIHSLGVKLEEMVEQILRSTGYLTKRRQRLVGKSGSTHEFNILATRGSEVIAVECKNCGDERSVGLKEMRPR